METPIQKAIKEFTRLKEKSNFRDQIYLDGVLSVLDSFVEYEQKFIKEIKSSKDTNSSIH